MNKLLQWGISLGMVVIPVLLYGFAVEDNDPNSLFFESIFFFYLGLVFIISSRYAHKLLIFKFIDFLCAKSSAIGGKYRSKIYGGAFCIAGLVAAFGWINFGFDL